MFCFFLNNNNCWPLYDNFVAAYFQGHLSASLFTFGKSEDLGKLPAAADAGRTGCFGFAMVCILSFGVDLTCVKTQIKVNITSSRNCPYLVLFREQSQTRIMNKLLIRNSPVALLVLRTNL